MAAELVWLEVHGDRLSISKASRLRTQSPAKGTSL
jgi:hypothetical protein